MAVPIAKAKQGGGKEICWGDEERAVEVGPRIGWRGRTRSSEISGGPLEAVGMFCILMSPDPCDISSGRKSFPKVHGTGSATGILAIMV